MTREESSHLFGGGRRMRARPSLVLVVFALGWFVASDSVVEAKHYTVEELQRTKFPNRVSDDLDLDPCKSGG